MWKMCVGVGVGVGMRYGVASASTPVTRAIMLLHPHIHNGVRFIFGSTVSRDNTSPLRDPCMLSLFSPNSLEVVH